MSTPISPFRLVLDNPWRFAWQVLTGFRANQGLLLAGNSEASQQRIELIARPAIAEWLP